MGLSGFLKKVLPEVAADLIPGGEVILKMAKSIAGTDNEKEAEAKITADPALQLELQKAVLVQGVEEMKAEADLVRADNEALAHVNETMRAELAADKEKWPVWAWRPFNGFLYGLTIFGVYFVLPLFKVTLPAVPTEIWMGWAVVLGVTTWHRGKEKRLRAGEAPQFGLIARAVKAFRA